MGRRGQALRLGDVNLASAALDSVSAADFATGDFGSSIPSWLRRWELRDRITDELELADLYSVGAWCYHELGDYAESVRIARAAPAGVSLSTTLHARSWLVMSLYRLGRWDDAVAEFDAVLDLLGDRWADPPPFTTAAFGTLAMVRQVRGDSEESARLAAVVDGMPASSVRCYPERIWLGIHRGPPDEAERLVADPPTAWQVNGAAVWAARCDIAWTASDPAAAGDTAEGAASFAARTGTRAVSAYSDRLAGVIHWRGGDPHAAQVSLQRAAQRFEELSMRFELARTRLLMAATGDATGDPLAPELRELGEAVMRDLHVVRDPLLDRLRTADGVWPRG